MSWITEWTTSIWEKLFKEILVDPLKELLGVWADITTAALPARTNQSMEDAAARSGMSESPMNPLIRIGANIMSIFGHAQAVAEPDVQDSRVSALKETNAYPIDPFKCAPFAIRTPAHVGYLERMCSLTGQYESVKEAIYDLARKQPDYATLRELYNRGYVNEEYVTELLHELGFVDQVAKFEIKPEFDDAYTTYRDRFDKKHMRDLFQMLPDINTIITMEMRDAFPQNPAIYPDEDKTELWHQWANETGAHRPEADTWEQGEGRSVLDALKEKGRYPEGTEYDKYGPQSYESWIQRARERYSLTFEAAAKAQGLDPYWAKKIWESHWRLPDYAMLREMLYRSPLVDENLMSTILRWQDYSPGFVDEAVRVAYRPLTRVDVRRMHLRGTIGIAKVFQSYLAFGYNLENAMNMTAFTVVWNADRHYGSLVNEITKSYSEDAITRNEASKQIWQLVAVDLPSQFPEWVSEQLTEEQIQAVKDTYDEINSQLHVWITRRLDVAKAEAEISLRRTMLETAKKQYTSWNWTETRVRQYLAEHDFDSNRINGLLREWLPLRQREERLPTRGMLEDFLLEQNMPVDTWRQYMQRLGYADTTIAQILEGVGRLPTKGMLEDFVRTEAISVEQFQSYMHRLGYDAWTVHRLLDAMGISY